MAYNVSAHNFSIHFKQILVDYTVANQYSMFLDILWYCWNYDDIRAGLNVNLQFEKYIRESDIRFHPFQPRIYSN